MISKCMFTLYLLIFTCAVAFSQSSTSDLLLVTEEISKEITNVVTEQKTTTTRIMEPKKDLMLKASLWPNPSNIGKVRLSVENLPSNPLFIQIFNEELELIQEGIINGSAGASLHHTLSLPDTSGTYSIKLSDENKIITDLELEIL